MERPFPYSTTGKRYHTLDYHLKRVFGKKVCKVPINGGFICPNLDGTKGTGGCIFCSRAGGGEFAGNPLEPMQVQYQKGQELLRKKWPDALCIAYFQARSNTYAPLPRLKSLFEPILKETDAVGLSIATRPDCLPKEVLDYLAELNRRTYLTVELGLQTVHDETGRLINRCHTYREFLEGYGRLRERDIPVCIHLINGLPGETREMMLASAKEIAKLDLHSVKIHLLHVLRDSPLGEAYLAALSGAVQGQTPQLPETNEGLCEKEAFPLSKEGGRARKKDEKMPSYRVALTDGCVPFELMTREDYVQTVCDQLELLPPSLVIQRLTGDGARDMLLGPMWSMRKREVLNEIDKELLRRDSMQGARYRPK